MKPRSIAGLILLFAGIGCYAASGLVMVQALEKQASNDDGLRRTEIACREQLVKLGRVQPRENNLIEVDFGEVKGDPRRLLGDVTAALAMCPGRNLQDVCLGTGCASQTPGGGVKMTVKLGLGAGPSK